MKYLGLDLGSKTLGIAISDSTKTIASIYKTLRFNENDECSIIPELEKIVVDENIEKIILGLPKNMNNTLGNRAIITNEFKEKLSKCLDVPIILEDERLTTVISENVLLEADISRKKRKKVIDNMAAVIILQNYLDKERK